MKIFRKNFIKRLSIFQKMLMAFVFVIFVFGTISYLVSENTTSKILYEQIFSSNLSSMELSANGVYDIVSRTISASTGLSVDTTLQECIMNGSRLKSKNDYEALQNTNKIFSIINSYIYSILQSDCYLAIVSKSGEIYANWPVNDKKNISDFKNKYINYITLFEQGYLKNSIALKGLEPNPISAEKTASPYVITIIVPVKSADSNELQGIIISNIPEDRISKKLNQNAEHKKLVVDAGMNIISTFDKSDIGLNLKDLSIQDIPSDEKGYFNNGKEKSDKIVSYLKLRQWDWQIIDIMDRKFVDREVGKVTSRLVLINFGSVIVLSFLSYIIALSISRPLKKLAGEMLNNEYSSVENQLENPGKNEVRLLEKSFRIMKRDIAQLIAENENKEREKRETEIRTLQAQIRPHFLFNTLNTIRWTAMNNNGTKAADMILALSTLLRMTLVKGEERISLHEEIESIKYYVYILKMRHSINFEMLYNIEPLLENYKIPKLLLQPLVENSIFHGLKGVKEGGVIRILCKNEDNGVLLKVSDNGCGLPEKSLEDTENKYRDMKFSGIGVNNVDKRVKLYFGEEYGLRLYNIETGGTAAEIRLPAADVQSGVI